MYIEFQLPEVPDERNYGANFAMMYLNIDIDDWVRKHNIQYHKTKRHKFTYRLILKNDIAYSHFALTWDPQYHYSKSFTFKQP